MIAFILNGSDLTCRHTVDLSRLNPIEVPDLCTVCPFPHNVILVSLQILSCSLFSLSRPGQKKNRRTLMASAASLSFVSSFTDNSLISSGAFVSGLKLIFSQHPLSGQKKNRIFSGSSWNSLLYLYLHHCSLFFIIMLSY